MSIQICPAARRRGRGSIFPFLFLVLANSILAQQPDWPCYYGSDRNSISEETGLLKTWPKAGPTLVWSTWGCGIGYTNVAVSGGRLYLAGNFDRRTYVLALDLEGYLLWKQPNMEAGERIPEFVDWAEQFHGVKSTPTVYRGMVYHLNEAGRIGAFDAETGREIWAVNIRERFDGKGTPCGYSESLLVDGDLVFCQPGGTRGFFAALDRKTGETVWANVVHYDSLASYVSPVLVEDMGVRQIITSTPCHVIGLNPADGRILWRIPHANRDKENIETPVYDDGIVGVSSSYGKGFDGIRLDYSASSIRATKIWTARKADNLHGGLIVRDGHAYGCACAGGRWFCVNLATGKELYRKRGVGLGSVVWADGLFYCLGHNGLLALVEASPEHFNIISQIQLPDDGQGRWFTHPVICGGRLYIRHGDNLYAYDMKSKP